MEYFHSDGSATCLLIIWVEKVIPFAMKSKQKPYPSIVLLKKVQVGKDQEKAQSERDSHSKNRGGKNQTNNQALIP